MQAFKAHFDVSKFPETTTIATIEIPVCSTLIFFEAKRQIDSDKITEEECFQRYKKNQPEFAWLLKEFRVFRRTEMRNLIRSLGVTFEDSLQAKFERFLKERMEGESAVDPLGLFEESTRTRILMEFAETLPEKEREDFLGILKAQFPVLSRGTWKRIPTTPLSDDKELPVDKERAALLAQLIWNYLCDEVDRNGGGGRVLSHKDGEKITSLHASLENFFKVAQPEVFSLMQKLRVPIHT